MAVHVKSPRLYSPTTAHIVRNDAGAADLTGSGRTSAQILQSHPLRRSTPEHIAEKVPFVFVHVDTGESWVVCVQMAGRCLLGLPLESIPEHPLWLRPKHPLSVEELV